MQGIEIVDFGDGWVDVKDPVTNSVNRVFYTAKQDTLGFTNWLITEADPVLLKHVGRTRLEAVISEFEA